MNLGGGECASTRLNRSRTAASLAPMYLLSTSGPFTLTKRIPAAATAAATTCVLPQPGGPYSSTPVRSRSGALRARTHDGGAHQFPCAESQFFQPLHLVKALQYAGMIVVCTLVRGKN